MPVKKYRPTSPGRRFVTTLDFSDLTKVAPERSLVEVRKKHSGRNNNGHITVRHRGGGTRRLYRHHRLQAREGRRSGEGRDDRVRSESFVPHRAAELSRRREALHPRAAGPAGRRARRIGPERRHQDRQRAADQEHSGRHGDSQHRAAPGPGRQARALGRRRRAAHGQGRRVLAGPHAVGRGAQDSHRVPRDDRPARQRRARESSDRQRPAARAISASARACAASR